MSAATEIDRLHELVTPIASDLDLDVYDIERRGGTLRVTLDTRPGADGGVTLDSLSLATRLISRELDHQDPIAGSYTLEVTSPGVERPLRTAAHFAREVGKTISARLRDPSAEPRRLHGTLLSADGNAATIACEDGVERTVQLDAIDKARVVVDWTPKPKPGKAGSRAKKQQSVKDQQEHVGSGESDGDETKETEGS
jgi:ribosome maturation factor RimP